MLSCNTRHHEFQCRVNDIRLKCPDHIIACGDGVVGANSCNQRRESRFRDNQKVLLGSLTILVSQKYGQALGGRSQLNDVPVCVWVAYEKKSATVEPGQLADS